MVRRLAILCSFAVVLLFHTGCVKGCIDDNALNYDPEATANKGCIYPETINVVSIGINSYPTEDNTGVEWDSDGTGPDKFIKIYNNNSEELLYTTETEVFTPVSWTLDPEITLNASNLVLRFELFDKDENEDVLMDMVTLDIDNLTGTTAETSNDLYPDSGTVLGSNGTVFKLSMNWTE
ncbi:MAG: hypothetical protein AB8B72_08365 [Crocinitomicaceae bacterium]